MAESLCALFEAHKPLKPKFRAVEVATVKESETPEAKEGKEEPEKGQQRSRKPKLKKEPDPREARTIFVGNVPLSYSRKKIKQLFKEYGTVESVRLRSMAVTPGDLPRHVARRTFKQIGGCSLNAYVVLSQEQEAEKCLALNGTLLGGRHLRVDLAVKPKPQGQSSSHCVFLGNLPFTADEEELRKAFEACGEVDSVRVVRDSKTNIGKGFGFLTFKERSGVVFALKKNNKVEIEGRTVRVFKCKDMGMVKAGSTRELRKPRFAGLQAKNPLAEKTSQRKNRAGGSGLRPPRDRGDSQYSGSYGDRGRGATGRGGRPRSQYSGGPGDRGRGTRGRGGRPGSKYSGGHVDRGRGTRGRGGRPRQMGSEYSGSHGGRGRGTRGRGGRPGQMGSEYSGNHGSRGRGTRGRSGRPRQTDGQ